MNEKERVDKDFEIVSNAMNGLLHDMENLDIEPQHVLFVSLSVVLGYILKFAPDKFDLFSMITGSMNYAHDANNEQNQLEHIGIDEWEEETIKVLH